MDRFVIFTKRNSDDASSHRVLVAVRHIVCIEEFSNGCLVMLSDDEEYVIEVTESFDDITALLQTIL